MNFSDIGEAWDNPIKSQLERIEKSYNNMIKNNEKVESKYDFVDDVSNHSYSAQGEFEPLEKYELSLGGAPVETSLSDKRNGTPLSTTTDETIVINEKYKKVLDEKNKATHEKKALEEKFEAYKEKQHLKRDIEKEKQKNKYIIFPPPSRSATNSDSEFDDNQLSDFALNTDSDMRNSPDVQKKKINCGDILIHIKKCKKCQKALGLANDEIQNSVSKDSGSGIKSFVKNNKKELKEILLFLVIGVFIILVLDIFVRLGALVKGGP